MFPLPADTEIDRLVCIITLPLEALLLPLPICNEPDTCEDATPDCTVTCPEESDVVDPAVIDPVRVTEIPERTVIEPPADPEPLANVISPLELTSVEPVFNASIPVALPMLLPTLKWMSPDVFVFESPEVMKTPPDAPATFPSVRT